MSSEPAFAPVAFPALGRDGDAAASAAVVRGHAAGYAAGRRVAEAELVALRDELEARSAAERRTQQAASARALDALAAAALSLQQAQDALVTATDSALSAAAVELAEALLGAELRRGDGTAHAALERALAVLPETGDRVVRLSPGDLDQLASAEIPAGVTLVADPAMSSGSAVGQFEGGLVDARIATALERVRAELEVTS
ncbi:MAG: FliH/SctL family protein [Microbacteriaceae bacterium]